jgi:hypothetical protein
MGADGYTSFPYLAARRGREAIIDIYRPHIECNEPK